MRLNMKPTSIIKARLGLQKGGAVHKFFTDTCYKHMDNYVPYADGNLAKIVEIGTDYIIYSMPYAHYMYEGKVMGPNIPIKENGMIVGWFSPKDKKKHYTGTNIDYSKSIARGHANAGPHWDKRMWSAEKNTVIQEVQDYIEKNGGK